MALASQQSAAQVGERVEFIGRIAYSRSGWRGPDPQRAKESGDSYVNANGFGHEDWLLRNEWLIDGWRYIFLQGVNKSYDALLRSGLLVFDMTLFTIEPDRRRRYVAHIRDMELLRPDYADLALECYRREGWYATMLAEIERAGGRPAAFGDPRFAKHPLNVRYRLENLVPYPPGFYAGDGDYAHRIKHYVISRLRDPAAVATNTTASVPRTAAAAAKAFPRSQPYFRSGTPGRLCTPEHAAMQRSLVERLRRLHPQHAVDFEVDGVDVLRESPEERVFYEIKSDLRPLSVIRQALGQLLEYAYAQPRTDARRVALVIVGRRAPSVDEAAYLQRLRVQFALPLHYEVVDLDPSS